MLLREATDDAVIAEAVLARNDYRLPDEMLGWRILDVGAHIGSFTVACLERGAAEVLAYEPNAETYRMLLNNLPPGKTVWANQQAVVGSNPGKRTLRLCNGGSRSGDTILEEVSFQTQQGPEVEAIEFDSIGGHFDLCKLDCEGSEYDIILNSRLLNRCQRLIVSFHYPEQLPLGKALTRILWDFKVLWASDEGPQFPLFSFVRR